MADRQEASEVEAYFDALRLGDALMIDLGHAAGPLPEAYCVIRAGRKWWPEVRRTAEALRAQGMTCTMDEGRGWFERDFTVRCDDAALIILHELGDRIRAMWLGPVALPPRNSPARPDACRLSEP